MSIEKAIVYTFEEIIAQQVYPKAYTRSFVVVEAYQNLEQRLLSKQAEMDNLNKNLRWLVEHAIDTAAISKAKGAELLNIPLIDFINKE